MLNATYEPLSVVSARRAVVLVVRQKADLVHANGGYFSSERLRVPIPSVIRLRRYVRVPYRRRVPLSRRAVFARDEFACQYCGSGAENLDHVFPRARGGSHTWENVVAACRACNTKKGDRTPNEAGSSCDRRRGRRESKAGCSSAWEGRRTRYGTPTSGSLERQSSTRWRRRVSRSSRRWRR